jgi:hypothetical protein
VIKPSIIRVSLILILGLSIYYALAWYYQRAQCNRYPDMRPFVRFECLNKSHCPEDILVKFGTSMPYNSMYQNLPAYIDPPITTTVIFPGGRKTSLIERLSPQCRTNLMGTNAPGTYCDRENEGEAGFYPINRNASSLKSLSGQVLENGIYHIEAEFCGRKAEADSEYNKGTQ